MDSKKFDIRIGEVTAQWCKSQKINCTYLPSIPSSNDLAKKEAFDQKSFENELIVYLTDHQPSGRGRFDRQWIQPRTGHALLTSFSFLIDSTPNPYMTTLIGLALHTACKSTWGFIPWSLKAPNDLYIQNKKVAGILVETVSQGDDHRLIVGIGFNILSAPEAVSESTSLLSNLKAETPLLGEDWIAFLDRLLLELTVLIPSCTENPTSTQKQNLIEVLNQFPSLSDKYENFDDLERVLKNL